jgi:AraC family transcriptional regulator
MSSIDRAKIVHRSPKDFPAAIAKLLNDALASFETDPEVSRQFLARTEGVRDTVREMCHALSSLLNEEPDSAQAHLKRAASSLRLIRRSPGLLFTVPKAGPKVFRGGLSPFQARRIKEHIETHLDAALQTNELAKLARLSSFHFCRVFRVSFGCSPRKYVTRCRIERAQALMLSTRRSLGQIAIECGFADQAHFNKQFRKFAGESPGEWRRLRDDGTSAGQAGPQSAQSSVPPSSVFATPLSRHVTPPTSLVLTN